MGPGTGFLLLVVVGFLLLGPARLQELLRQVAKLKAQFDHSRREITSQLAAEIDEENSARK